MKKLLIVINNQVEEVESVQDMYNNGYLLSLDSGKEYYIFPKREDAEKATKEYWKDMAENDPKELSCIIGEENLVKWALGHSAGPGSVCVNSFQEWLEVAADHPEEHFANYDDLEIDGVSLNKHLRNETGIWTNSDDIVLYRHN